MAPQGHLLSEETKEELEKYASIDSVNYTEYDDLFFIQFRSGACRPGSLADEIGDWDICHVNFDEREVEYMKE